MKNWTKTALVAAIMCIAQLTMAQDSGVTTQEVENYVLMQTPYTQVLSVTRVGQDFRVQVGSNAKEIDVYVEWDSALQQGVIERWVDIPGVAAVGAASN
ncbi:MAG: hypothetical protein KDD36_13535 [Flavobacteriales bacterium]|nr:hypothetical protein [Flavobacteriales bacterium]